MSRRAGGLSIGVNLNLGQECNWACVYCEVEGLVRGAPGPVDLARLEQELDAVLTEASSGRWSNGTTGDGLPAEGGTRAVQIYDARTASWSPHDAGPAGDSTDG